MGVHEKWFNTSSMSYFLSIPDADHQSTLGTEQCSCQSLQTKWADECDSQKPGFVACWTQCDLCDLAESSWCTTAKPRRISRASMRNDLQSSANYPNFGGCLGTSTTGWSDPDVALKLLSRLSLHPQMSVLGSEKSMHEEVPDACGLYPWDVGRGAREDAGLVLHRAADGPEAHDAVDFPTVSSHLTQQRATRITLERRTTWWKCEKWRLYMVDFPIYLFLLPGRRLGCPLCLWSRHRSWSLLRGHPRISSVCRSCSR